MHKDAFGDRFVVKLRMQPHKPVVFVYRIARMGQNFDDYPGFQQIPGMPILLQHSVFSLVCLFLRFLLANPAIDTSNIWSLPKGT